MTPATPDRLVHVLTAVRDNTWASPDGCRYTAAAHQYARSNNLIDDSRITDLGRRMLEILGGNPTEGADCGPR